MVVNYRREKATRHIQRIYRGYRGRVRWDHRFETYTAACIEIARIRRTLECTRS